MGDVGTVGSFGPVGGWCLSCWWVVFVVLVGGKWRVVLVVLVGRVARAGDGWCDRCAVLVSGVGRGSVGRVASVGGVRWSWQCWWCRVGGWCW